MEITMIGVIGPLSTNVQKVTECYAQPRKQHERWMLLGLGVFI